MKTLKNGFMALAATLALSTATAHTALASDYRMPLVPDSQVTVGRLTLLIDTSGSMSGQRLRDAKAASERVVNLIHNKIREMNRSEDTGELFQIKVSVLGFGGSNNRQPFTSRLDFNTDKSSQMSAIRRMSVSGLTPLGPAVDEAWEKMAGQAMQDVIRSNLTELKQLRNNNAIILLSDGGDTTSNFDETITGLRHKIFMTGVQAPVYAVGLGLGAGVASKQLNVIADATGGDTHFVEESSALPRVFSDITNKWLMKVSRVLNSAEERLSQQYPDLFNPGTEPKISDEDRDFFSDGFFDD